MLAGVCTYRYIPLEAAAGLGSAGSATWKGVSGELLMWARRHQVLRDWSTVIIALHIVLPAVAAMHHFTWVDLSGRLFGATEVLTIVSYQFFVAYFASDDFEMFKRDDLEMLKQETAKDETMKLNKTEVAEPITPEILSVPESALGS